MSLSPFTRDDVVTDRGGRLMSGGFWWRWFNDLRSQFNQHDARITTLETQDTSVLATLAGYATAFTTVALAATTVSASALVFPEPQVPSADAHTLDDYEEGSWTPALLFGGAAVGMTYTTQVGSYVKVGRLVTATCRMDLSAKGSSTGSATVSGLPFAAASGSASFNGAGLAGGMSGLTSPVTPRVVAGASVLDLFDWGAAGVVALDNANFNNTSAMAFTLTYLAGD